MNRFLRLWKKTFKTTQVKVMINPAREWWGPQYFRKTGYRKWTEITEKEYNLILLLLNDDRKGKR